MEDIQRLRKKIDEIDENLLRLLGERSEICRSIGLLKKEQGMPIIDTFRENEVFTTIKAKAADFGLDGDRVEGIYRQIVIMCSSVQGLREKEE